MIPISEWFNSIRKACDARTPLADFFSILLEGKWARDSAWTGGESNAMLQM